MGLKPRNSRISREEGFFEIQTGILWLEIKNFESCAIFLTSLQTDPKFDPKSTLNFYDQILGL